MFCNLWIWRILNAYFTFQNEQMSNYDIVEIGYYIKPCTLKNGNSLMFYLLYIISFIIKRSVVSLISPDFFSYKKGRFLRTVVSHFERPTIWALWHSVLFSTFLRSLNTTFSHLVRVNRLRTPMNSTLSRAPLIEKKNWLQRLKGPAARPFWDVLVEFKVHLKRKWFHNVLACFKLSFDQRFQSIQYTSTLRVLRC
jgi:hypothetical protein